MNSNANPNCNIFSVLLETITTRDEKQQVRKMPKLWTVEPLQVAFLKGKSLRCKQCGTRLSLVPLK